MNEENYNIFGCFVSGGSTTYGDSQETIDIAKEKGIIFRNYIWGEKGIDNVLKKLNHENYGKDIKLILFQFYVNPIPYLLNSIKPIENYRKNEKSIGVPIIVNDNNFFNMCDKDKKVFLINSILKKLDLLSEVVVKKKLDTKIELLKSDVNNILHSIWKPY